VYWHHNLCWANCELLFWFIEFGRRPQREFQIIGLFVLTIFYDELQFNSYMSLFSNEIHLGQVNLDISVVFGGFEG
jgi:hypothetical protein